MLTLYEAALEETAARTLTDVRSVDLSAPSSEKGADAWQDLPLKKFTKARGLTNLVVAHEHTGLIDLADAQLKFEAQDFANLPGPLGTSGDTSAFRLNVQFLVYQLAAAANGQPRCFVLKHYKLTEGVLQNADTKKFRAEEHLFVIDWRGSQPGVGKKAFQYLFEKVGGAQFRLRGWREPVGAPGDQGADHCSPRRKWRLASTSSNLRRRGRTYAITIEMDHEAIDQSIKPCLPI